MQQLSGATMPRLGTLIQSPGELAPQQLNWRVGLGVGPGKGGARGGGRVESALQNIQLWSLPVVLAWHARPSASVQGRGGVGEGC